MPGDKLSYFQEKRGRGETGRMLLSMSGKPHEIDNVPLAEWASRKSTFPTGTLPVLTTESGKRLVQSAAINRYIAKKYGFMGSDLWQEAENDMMICHLDEVRGIIAPTWGFLVLGATKPEYADKAVAAANAKWLKLLPLLEKQAGGKKYLISDEVQLADVYLFTTIEYSLLAVPNLLQLNTWLSHWHSRFTNDRLVKRYLSSRPQALYIKSSM